MAIAVPTDHWGFVRKFTPERLAHWLCFIAKQVPMEHFKRSRREHKKPQPKRESGKRNQHVSVKRLLDQTNLKSAR